MNQENIGKFIAALRKEKKLTQEQLAEKLGVNNRTVSRWENGHCLPDLSLLEELSKEFDVSVSEILNAKKMTREELIELRDSINLLIDSDGKSKVKADELNKTFIPEIEKGYEIYKMTKKKDSWFSDVRVQLGTAIAVIILVICVILCFPYIKASIDRKLDYAAYLELCTVLNTNNIMYVQYSDNQMLGNVATINVDEYAFRDLEWWDSEEPEYERLEDRLYVLFITLRNGDAVVLQVYNFDFAPKVRVTYKDRCFLCHSVSLYDKEGLIFENFE